MRVAVLLLSALFLGLPARALGADLTLSGAEVALGNAGVTISGNMLLSGGSLSADAANMTIGGNWTVTGGSFIAGTSTLTFNATTAGHQVTSQGWPFAHVVFNGTGGYWTLQDSMTVLSNLTLTAGTLDTGSSGNFGISLAGNWSNNGGTFIPNQSTVTITGTGTSTTTWAGSTSFYALQCLIPGKTLVFTAASVQTVTHSLTLTGAAGQLIRLRSSLFGAFAYLTNLGAQSVSFLDVRDNNAGGGNTLLSGSNSINSGHNVNWNFGHIAPSNAQITDVAVSSLGAAWDSVTSESGYSLEASTASDFTGTRISAVTADGGAMSLLLPASLSSNTTYYLRVGSLWNDGTTDYINTTPLSTSTLSGAVSGFEIDSLFTTTGTFHWTALPAAPLSASAEGYVVQASTLLAFTGTILSTSTADASLSTLALAGLTPGTLYFFRVGSLNWNNVPHFGAIISATTATGGPPRSPATVWGFMNSIGDLFVLSWHAVTLDIDGFASTIDHYLIERSDHLGDSPTFSDTVAATANSYSQSTGGQMFFYRIKAVGTNGFTSLPSDYVDSSAQANRYILADDNMSTRLLVPSDPSRELLAENNIFGEDISLQLTRRTEDESPSTLRSYSLIASRPDFHFSQAGSTLQFELSAPAASSGLQAVIYWNNGQSFIPISSPASVQGLLSVTTRNTGIYQVRLSAPNNSHFQLTGGSPYPRVISPNAANNRRAFFFFDNPSNETISGTIYNREGATVRELHVSDQSPSPQALVWDGKDDHGTVVRSGIYLYKIHGGGQTLTGSIVVAR